MVALAISIVFVTLVGALMISNKMEKDDEERNRERDNL